MIKKRKKKRWWNIQSKVPKHKQTKAFPHHNNDSIRNIVSKIQVLEKELEARTEDLKKQNNVINQKRNQANQIVCKHSNRGYCKRKSLCWYFHPTDICKIFLKDGKCSVKDCFSRHPNFCKYQKQGCNRGSSCVYLHSNSYKKADVNIEPDINISEIDHKNYYDSEAASDEIISNDIDMEIETIVDPVNNDNSRVE